MNLYHKLLQWIQSDPSQYAQPREPKIHQDMQGYGHHFGKIVFPVEELSHSEVPYESQEEGLYQPHIERYHRIMSVLLTVMIAVMLLFMVADSPISGTTEDNPTLNEVTERYLSEGVEETGAVNYVAGIILDYRAFDTFGEAAMVFTSIIGVIFLLKDFKEDSHLKKGER